MKRKLALLLAGTMALTTVSTSTIFAANGEMNLISTITEGSTTATTSGAAVVAIGDNTQVIPVGAAFTFELVNGKFVADSASYSHADANKVVSTENRINVITKDSTLSGDGQLTFDFAAVDASEPTYLKVTYSNVTGFTGKTIQLTQVAGTSAVTSTVTDATQGTLGYAHDGQVTISAALADGIEAGNVYKISLPSGYKFADSGLVAAADMFGATGTITTALNSDNRTITVTVGDDYAENMMPFGSSFVVSSLDIINSNNVYNKEVEVTVKKGSTVLVKDVIAAFNTFSVSTSVDEDDIEDYTAGLADPQAVATITVKENLADSFRGGDLVFTLPSGVEAHNAVVADASSVAGTFTYSEIVVDDNEITVKNVNFNENVGKFELDFDVTVPANFEGDLTATLTSGTNSIDIVDTIEIGTIAKFTSVMEIKTEISEVLVGYTNQATNDIVISEKEAGTFVEGQEFVITLSDSYDFADGYGITDVASDVTVTNGKASATTSGTSVIVVTLDEIENDEELVSIVVDGIEVSSNRYVPTYVNEVVKVKVDVQNYTSMSTEYIKFVYELSEITSTFNKNVEIAVNSDTATLADGSKVDLYGTPYISADGNFMAPVKGFAFALGLEADDIVFDEEAKIATFFLSNGSVAQIQAENKYVTVDGVKLPLIDAHNKLVAPVLFEGRFYLPLRACANTMFGVDVDYNNADKSVVLNPSK